MLASAEQEAALANNAVALTDDANPSTQGPALASPIESQNPQSVLKPGQHKSGTDRNNIPQAPAAIRSSSCVQTMNPGKNNTIRRKSTRTPRTGAKSRAADAFVATEQYLAALAAKRKQKKLAKRRPLQCPVRVGGEDNTAAINSVTSAPVNPPVKSHSEPPPQSLITAENHTKKTARPSSLSPSINSSKAAGHQNEPDTMSDEILPNPVSGNPVIAHNFESVKDNLPFANVVVDPSPIYDKEIHPPYNPSTPATTTTANMTTAVSSIKSATRKASSTHTTELRRCHGIIISDDEDTSITQDKSLEQHTWIGFETESRKQQKVSSVTASAEDEEGTPLVQDDSLKRTSRVTFETESKKRQKVANVTASGEDNEVAVHHPESNHAAQEEPDAGEKSDWSQEDEYEVEEIVGHKVYRSNAVKYHIKWVGYGSKQNTWEPAKAIHQSCPELCAAYWTKKNIPVPLNVPLIPHPPRVPPALRRFANRLSERNITEDSFVPEHRDQGFQLAYGLKYPKLDTVWENELRAIHSIHRVDGTDQILAYVSWMNTKKTVHAIEELHERCPDQVLRYYEARMAFD